MNVNSRYTSYYKQYATPRLARTLRNHCVPIAVNDYLVIACQPSLRKNTFVLNRIAGIDFGTSNSSVGIFRNNQPDLLDINGEGTAAPSAIFYPDEGVEAAFGKRAVNLYTQGVEGRLLRSLKSVLGTSLMQEKTQVRNRRVAFSAIIEDYFMFLNTQLEQQTSQRVDSVVLGRPVHFVDNDQKRDIQAQEQLAVIARNAGFEHIEFQLEPIAAALHYESTLAKEELVVIIDIGGGTADFSVLRLSPEHHAKANRQDDILTTMGVHIGGTDFDRLLSLHSVMPSLGYGSLVQGTNRALPGSLYFDLATWHKIPLLYQRQVQAKVQQMLLDAQYKQPVKALKTIIDERLGHSLARAVEIAKINLSESAKADIQLFDDEELLVDVAATRVDMQVAIESDVEKLRACVAQGLNEAQLTPADVVNVFYTGGSSGVPYLRSVFEQMMPQASHTHGDAFGSVCLGLTIDAARRFA